MTTKQLMGVWSSPREGGLGTLLARAALMGAVLGALCGSLCAQVPTGPGPEERLADALYLLRSDEEGASERCRAELDRLAAPAARLLVAALVEPGSMTDERGPLMDGSARALLVEALGGLHEDELAPVLVAALEQAATAPARLRAIELLGELGGPGALDPLFAAAQGMDPVLMQNPTVCGRFERALAGLLRRHPRTHALLEARTEVLDAGLQCAVARAIGSAGSGAGLPTLDRMLGRSALIDRAVLESVGRLDPADPLCVQGASRFLSWHLSSADPESRYLAITSLGTHGGAADCGLLIGLLEEGDREVVAATHWALKKISGRDWPADASTWSRWYAAELDWFATGGPGLIDAALGGDRGHAFAALAELSSHPLFRRELAAELEPALLQAEPVIAASTCSALARLGGPVGAALLARASGDERAAVAEAATRALAGVRAY